VLPSSPVRVVILLSRLPNGDAPDNEPTL